MRQHIPAVAPLVFVAGVAVVFAAAAAAWRILRRLRSADERERRRRLHINLRGRMGEATITDVREQVAYYNYEVRGVAYAASQDLSALRPHLPEDPCTLIGHSGLKYHPRNPANSILLCESWSGLRARPAALSAQNSKGEQTTV